MKKIPEKLNHADLFTNAPIPNNTPIEQNATCQFSISSVFILQIWIPQ